MNAKATKAQGPKQIDMLFDLLYTCGFPEQLRKNVSSILFEKEDEADIVTITFFVPDGKGGFLSNPVQGAVEATMSFYLDMQEE